MITRRSQEIHSTNSAISSIKIPIFSHPGPGPAQISTMFKPISYLLLSMWSYLHPHPIGLLLSSQSILSLTYFLLSLLSSLQSLSHNLSSFLFNQ